MIHTRNTITRTVPRHAANYTGVFLAVFVAALVLSAAPSLADAPATLPASIITGASPQDNVIQAFLETAVARLRGENAVEQKEARDAILAPFSQAPSPAFVYAYTRSLNDRLISLAKDKAFRVRLNTAIIAARVAEHDQNHFMAPTILALLNDTNESIVMWALKAIKPIMTEQSIATVKDTVKRVPALTFYGYNALSAPAPTAAYIDAITDVMDARVKSYENGIPEDPLAENAAMLKLMDTTWWKSSTPVQQTRTAQTMLNLAAAVLGQFKEGMPNDQLEDLREVIRKVGASVQTMGIVDVAREPLKAPGQIAYRLPKLAAASQVRAAVAGLCGPLKLTFPSITIPASISATNSSPASGNITSTK